jgi:hypothetical protein
LRTVETVKFTEKNQREQAGERENEFIFAATEARGEAAQLPERPGQME